MLQVPIVIPKTLLPLTVQIVGVALVKLTARVEDDVAETAPLPPTTSVGAVPNVIFWGVLFGVTELLSTDVALMPALLVAVTVNV